MRFQDHCDPCYSTSKGQYELWHINCHINIVYPNTVPIEHHQLPLPLEEHMEGMESIINIRMHQNHS